MQHQIRTIVFAGLAVLTATGVFIYAQDAVRVQVRLVNVIATVTDDQGRYINGLDKDNFTVEEDGVKQEIAHFDSDQDLPVSVGLILDTSGSMQNKIRIAVDAVDGFIRSIHQDDDIFLMTFASKTTLRQDFTNDRNKLSKALHNAQISGGTALYDALEEGVYKIKSGRHDKRAILLMTDGEDTSSLTRLNEVLQSLRESEVLVYSLGISPMTYADTNEHVPFNLPSTPGSVRIPPAGRGGGYGRRDSVDMNVMKSFAEDSGGRAFLLSDTFIGGRGSQIEKVLSQIADELRSQYSLGYYPSHPDDGKFHTITVTSKTGSVRARRGYLAPGPPGR